jgi:mersacidin/lichenicidin family type 2 lantibiotic
MLMVLVARVFQASQQKTDLRSRERKHNTMSTQNIIRAWKDASYRSSLIAAEQALLPANPAGAIELHAIELEQVFGAGEQTVSFNTTMPIVCPTCSFSLTGKL